jgi:hypothetical protein
MHLSPALILLSTVLAGSAVCQEPDPAALVRQSVDNYERDWRIGMHWGYTQTDVTHTEDGKEVNVSEIAPLFGTPYERLISKDGHPLDADEQRKEDEKYEKTETERRNESPSERQARIQKYKSQRAFFKEIPDAYNFKLLGEENVAGRPAWVLQMEPRPDFVPSTSHAAMLKHIEGKLWIDKQDVQWAKAEAHVKDTISIGWIVARIGPGAHITLDFTRLSSSLWLPKSLKIHGTAKVFLVHTKDLNEELTFTNYHQETGADKDTETKNSIPHAPGKAFR